MTAGRGVDGVVDAVGMEAHGTPFQAFALAAAGKLPGPLARKAAETMGVDRMGAMRTAFASVRRAGTISLIGVYGGQADPFPMMDLFDKGVTIRMGQAHVKRWVEEIMPALTGDDDPLAPRTSPPMRYRWSRPRTATRSSRRSRTAASRPSSSPDSTS